MELHLLFSRSISQDGALLPGANRRITISSGPRVNRARQKCENQTAPPQKAAHQRAENATDRRPCPSPNASRGPSPITTSAYLRGQAPPQGVEDDVGAADNPADHPGDPIIASSATRRPSLSTRHRGLGTRSGKRGRGRARSWRGSRTRRKPRSVVTPSILTASRRTSVRPVPAIQSDTSHGCFTASARIGHLGSESWGATDRPITAAASQATTPISVPKVREMAVIMTICIDQSAIDESPAPPGRCGPVISQISPMPA
jgi:hypothetical protein